MNAKNKKSCADLLIRGGGVMAYALAGVAGRGSRATGLGDLVFIRAQKVRVVTILISQVALEICKARVKAISLVGLFLSVTF